ncbi:MAG: cell division protein FtsQ/DivIB [bacterium]
MPSKQDSKQKETVQLFSGMARMLSGVLALLLVGVGGYSLQQYLSDPQRFPLSVIEVKGEFSHLDRGNLQQVVANAMQGGFFSADIDSIQDAVKALPWVSQVYITRRWPDRLIMKVEEQVPLANWGKTALVDAEGEVFRPQRRDPAIKLQLFGDDEEALQVVSFYRQIDAMTRQHQLSIIRFGKNLHRDWIAEFSNGVQINLGRDHGAERLQTFLAQLPRIGIEGKRVISVDLRYEQGFSVHWGDDPESQNQEEAA